MTKRQTAFLVFCILLAAVALSSCMMTPLPTTPIPQSSPPPQVEDPLESQLVAQARADAQATRTAYEYATATTVAQQATATAVTEQERWNRDATATAVTQQWEVAATATAVYHATRTAFEIETERSRLRQEEMQSAAAATATVLEAQYQATVLPLTLTPAAEIRLNQQQDLRRQTTLDNTMFYGGLLLALIIVFMLCLSFLLYLARQTMQVLPNGEIVMPGILAFLVGWAVIDPAHNPGVTTLSFLGRTETPPTVSEERQDQANRRGDLAKLVRAGRGGGRAVTTTAAQAPGYAPAPIQIMTSEQAEQALGSHVLALADEEWESNE